jgi:hypothetical protein
MSKSIVPARIAAQADIEIYCDEPIAGWFNARAISDPEIVPTVAESSKERTDGTAAQNKQEVPPYRCPGCLIELVTGAHALVHLNRCSTLRNMISGSSSGFFAWNGGIAAANEKVMIDEAQQHDKKKTEPPLQFWKANGPVVSIRTEKNTAPVEMDASASIKKRTRKSRSQLNHFKPHRLLDAVIETLMLENDAALAETLQVPASVISKIRNGKLPVGASILVRMHEASDMPIAKLRALIPDDTRYREIINEIDEPHELYQ